MAFKLSSVDTFTWPVTVFIPINGGKHREARFTARYKLLPQDRLTTLFGGRDDDAELEDTDALGEFFVGWEEDLQDEAGQPVPVNEETLKQVLNIVYVRPAILNAYLEALSKKYNRRKN